MRLVACLVAVLALAGSAWAIQPLGALSGGAGSDPAAQGEVVGLGAAGSDAADGVVQTIGAGTPVVSDGTDGAGGTIGTVGTVADGVADTAGGLVQGVPVAGPVVHNLPDALGVPPVQGAVPEAPEAQDPDKQSPLPPAQAAAPIAAVGTAAAAWHLRFVPWRRLAGVAWRVLAAVPLAGLFSRIEDDALKDHPVRARILQVLEERPGASIQEIQEAADVAWGTVVYHLGRLSQARHVVSQRDGRNHRFWVESDPEARNRKAAFILKSATPAAIAATVAAEPGIHQGALCARLEILPATASKYLKRLADQGLVRVRAEAQRRLYYPTPSLEAMVQPAPFDTSAAAPVAVATP